MILIPFHVHTLRGSFINYVTHQGMTQKKTVLFNSLALFVEKSLYGVTRRRFEFVTKCGKERDPNQQGSARYN